MPAHAVVGGSRTRFPSGAPAQPATPPVEATALPPVEAAPRKGKTLDERLAACEERFIKGLAGFRDGLAALRQIRDERLYKGQFKDFEDYCQRRHGLCRRQINRLLQADRELEELGPNGLVLKKESHFRELRKRPVEIRPAILERLSNKGKAVTTRSIAEAAVEVAREHDFVSDVEMASAGEAAPLDGMIPLEVVDGPPAVAKNGGERLLVAVPKGLIPGATRGDDRADLVPANWLKEHYPQFDVETVAGIVRLIDLWRESGYRPSFNETNDSIDWANWTFNVVTGCRLNCPWCYMHDKANFRKSQGTTPTFYPGRLLALEYMKPPESEDPADRRVFIDSMADLFGGWIPRAVHEVLLSKLGQHPEWTFMSLTKLPKRMVGLDFPPNLWVGTSIVDQSYVQAAEEAMREVNASVRWASFEPLEGPVVLSDPSLFDLYVIGARTAARKMPAQQPEWAWVESLHMQARDVGAAVYWKENLQVRPKEIPEPRPRQTPDESEVES